MTTMKTEILTCLRRNLETDLDAWLLQTRFGRRKNTLVYMRKLPEAIQKIELSVEIHPLDHPDAAAALYPFVEVRMAAVNALVMEMTGGDVELAGEEDFTLRQPVALTSGGSGLGGRWPIFQADSVPGVVNQAKSFLRKWTVPFLTLYSTPAGICEAYDRSDARVTNELDQKLRVVAAMVLCDRVADALGVMERCFGRPGPRRRYQSVFEYLASKAHGT